MDLRPYDPQRDLDAVLRIWREVGWIDGDSTDETAGVEAFVNAGRSHVAEISGAAECLVVTMPGSMHYLDVPLPLSVVAAVTTSHVARRTGLGGRLTALAVAADAAGGAAVSALGMFDQGYYNRIGFGTGSPTAWRTFDPADLRVPTTVRPPVRLGADDWRDLHAGRCASMTTHGSVIIDPPGFTAGEIQFVENGFGLGYRDETGVVTHHLWFEAKDMEHGPLTVSWMAYRSYAELLELLAVVASLGDQYAAVKMQEPPGIQLQDLLHRPFRSLMISRRSTFETGITAHPYWQVRICDLVRCLSLVRTSGDKVRFNLRLEDPIADLLPPDAEWRGVGGEYRVRLAGDGASVETGADPAVPTIEASVAAFTRWWLGVLPAAGLAATDRFVAPDDLVETLDRTIRLPLPRTVWDF